MRFSTWSQSLACVRRKAIQAGVQRSRSSAVTRQRLAAIYLTCQMNGSITWHANYLATIKGADMGTNAYAVVHFFEGGTQDQYEASIAAVHPGPGILPAGQ